MKNALKQFMSWIMESSRFLSRRKTAPGKTTAACGQNCFPDIGTILARAFRMFAALSLMLLFLLPVSNARAEQIFVDNFDDVSDTALDSHTPDVGDSWAIIIQNGGGQLRVDASASELDILSGGQNDGVLYTANLIGGYPTADYEVSIDTNNGDTGDDWNYLALRIQDASNMYVVQFNESGGQIYKQTTSGGWATLGSAFGGVTDGSTVTFRAVGSTLTVLDDGAVVRTLSDTDITAAGKAGVGMGDVGINSSNDLSAQRLDTFIVNALTKINGTVYTDEGLSAMAAGRTVAVSINGGAVIDTDDTDGSGNFSISGLDINSGDVITVFLDGETENAVAVTRATGSDMTIDLYEDYLITRADDGGALTNANLDTANNVGGGGDADINAIYTMSGTALTVVSGVELLVWTGDEFAPGDTVTAGNLDINGTFTMAANDVNVSGDWDASSGQFSGSGGTVTFNASTGATFDIISNSGTFGDININTTGGSVIELEDAMVVAGTLTITQGTFDVNAGENNSLTVGGGWDNAGSFEARAGTVTLTGTQALDVTTGGDDFYNLTFNGSGSWELQDALDVNGALTISQGTLDVNAVSSYTINVGGDWTNSGSFLARSGTVAFDATSGSPTITSGGAAFNNIELSDGGNDITFTLESNLDINGTLKITDGDLDVKSGENNRINIAGNWINRDLFTARSGEVVFDGGDQTLLGSTVFYKFTKTETTDDSTDTVLTFEAGQTQTMLGQWALNGLDTNDRIQLRSTDPGVSDWDVDPESTRVLSYLEVQNSNNVSGVTVDCTNNCMDDGDNTDWNFTSVPITITGTVYIDQGMTDIGSGITVAVSINGGAIDATDTTDANGGYSITTVSNVGATSILTLFINDETENAVTVTNATGTDMAGIDLYQDYLIVRNDNYVALTNANLDTANNLGDGDVDAIYTIPSANNLRTTNGTELLVPLGHTFEPGGNVEVGVSGMTSMLDISGTMAMNTAGFLEVAGTMDVSGTFIGDGGYLDINGDLSVSSGSLTSTTGSLMVAGTVSLASGSFTHNSGAFVLDGTGQQTVSAGSNTFNSITVTNASGAGVLFDEAFTVQNFINTTPNSTMKFQQNTTFIFNGTLTLAGTSGNQITLDSANSTDRFIWQMASPQTVYYVFVSNAEATVNNIRAETSSAGLNTDRLDIAPQWIFASPSEISIATGRFTMSTGTGDLSVTGVGFQPKAYILFLTKNDTDDVDSDGGSGLGSQLSIGMTDGTNQFCMTSGVEDDQGTSDVGRRGFETSQGSEVGNAVACNIDVGSGSQNVRGEASHVSMDADGFTINRSATFTEPTNVLVEYIAFGGADLNANVDLVNLNDTVDNSVNVTTPGFEPDLVITSFTGKYLDATGNNDNDDDSISYGWAINPTIQATDNQFSITKSSRDGQSTATGQTRIDSSYAGISFRDGTIDTGFEIENFDASGFDVTTRVSASGDNEIMGYLALDLGSNPQIFSVSQNTRFFLGTEVYEDARFEPIFLMGIGGAVVVDPDTNTSGASFTIGITDGSTEYTMLLHDEDSTSTTNTHSRTTSTKFMSAYTDTGSIEWESEFQSFDVNGWTLDYTDGTFNGYLNAYLAIGVEPAPVTITGRAFADEGLTPVSTGTKISVAVNGGTRKQSDLTDASGNFNFSIIMNAGDVVVVYIDEGGADKGAAITESDGNNLTDFDIYVGRLILDNDNGGSLTNADLDLADDIGDPDVTSIFSVLGGAATVSDGYELFIPSGHTFVPGGDLTIYDVDVFGGLTMASNTLTVSATFEIASGGSFSSTGNTIFDMETTVTGTFNGSAFNNLTINGAAGTLVLEDDLTVNGNLVITNGTLDVNVSENNAVEVGGSWSNSGLFLPRMGSVILTATSGTPTIDNGTSEFHNLTLDDSGNDITFTLQNNLDLKGDLTILDGNLDANAAGNYAITIEHDWNNMDMFTPRSGSVVLDGTDQNIVGSTTFYNLTKSETVDDSTDVTVTFDVTGSLVILNTWAFNGLDSDDQIIIKPDTPSTEWFVDPRGVRAISYLDVIYSNNVSGTTVDCTTGCNDGGNNIDWNFTASTITVSGSVFIDEGVTNIGSGTTVRLAINGVTDNSDTTDANGGFSISSSAPAGSGSVLTLYIDSGGGDAGVTITLSDGSDSTGIDIYRDYLLLRAENSGSVTNSNLDTGNDNGDTDIDAIYTMSGTTVTVVNGKELLVLPGYAYMPAGDVNIGSSGATTLLDVSGTMHMGTGETLTVRGTLDVSGEFYGSDATVDVNGDLTVSAGLFSAPTTTLTVSGTVDLASGTYTHNSSTIEFDGTQQQTVAAGTNTFNQITLSNGSGPGVIFTEAFTTANFTNTTIASTMTFQQSTTFTITNTLTLSGSSGNEIVLDSVDGSTRFTLAVTGGSQSVNYVDVSNSQTSSNNIIANNSNEGLNTDAADSAPHWVFPPPVALEVDTGRFTLTSGTGNFSVTGVGFQPSAYILFLTKNDTDDADSAEGTGNGGLISIGMTDGTRQFCMATGSEDNQDTADVGRRGFTDEVVCNIDVGDAAQNVRGEANHVSFDADGFTINRGVSFSEPSSVLVEYIAFGGTDLSVRVDTVDLNNTQDASVDETSPGFEPDVVFTSFIGHFLDATNDGDNDDSSFSFGWAVNPALQSTENQYSMMVATRDNQGTSQTATRFDDAYAGTSYRDGSIDASYEINTFDSSGFSVTTRLATATTDEVMGYMALEFGSSPLVFSGQRTSQISTGDDIVTDPRFKPKLLIGIGGAVATSADTNTSGNSLAIGITDGTDTYALSYHDQNNVDVSNTHSRTTDTQFFSALADNGSIDWEASFSSFDDNGWTLNYGDGATGSYLTAYFAFGTVAAPVTVVGTVYTNEGVTNIGSGKTVALSINGAAAIQTSETDANGAFEFTIDTDPGDVVSVYLEDETEKAVTVSVSDGNLLSGFDLYQDYLIIRNDNSGSTTNTDLALADNNGDSDISDIYTMSGNELVVPDGVELLINAGMTYAPGDAVTVEDVDVNGVFTMAANAITISGSFDATGGTFTSTGTVTFDALASRVIISNDNAFNDVDFNGATGTWVLEDEFNANGNLLITTGTLDVNAAENNGVNLGGYWLNNGSFLERTGTVTFDGSSSATITSNGGPFYNLAFDGASGTWVLEDTLNVNGTLTITDGTLDVNAAENNAVMVAGSWLNSGNFMAQTGTVTFDATGGSPGILTGSSAFYHVDFNDSGNGITFTLQDDFNVDGDLTITGGELDVDASGNYSINIEGNWTNNDIFTAQAGTVVFDASSGTADIVPGGSDFYNIQFNDGGGGATFELENAINVNGTLSLTSGMLDTKATENNDINVGGNWLNDGGTFAPRQATVVFDAAAGSPTITSNSQAFYNVEFDDAGNNITFTLDDALDVNGTLRITGGNLDTKSGENNSIRVAGNWLNQDLFTARNGMVTLDGTMGSPTITSGGQAFYFLDIDDSDFNVDYLLLDPLDVNGTLMITSGTLDVNAAGNYMINVGGAWSSQDTFLARTGTVSFDATSGTPAIYSYGQSFYNIDFDDGGNAITFLLEDALDVNGTLRINNGILDVKLGENNDITVFGNWINYGTFRRRAGDVTLDGDDQDIRGTTTFYDLTKLETTDDSTDVTVTFDVTGSLVIDNVWTFSGLDADDRIVLLPSVPVTQWDIDPQGARAISYLDPTYSRNVNITTIQCTNGCNDGGNNINWNFTAGVITVSGSVYIDEGITSIGAGTAVRLDVNGVTDNTDTTDGSGSYSITSSATVGNGAIVTLYLDTGGGDAGVTVLVSNGSNVSDADIYRDYLLVRSDNGNFVSNLNMDTANNSGDTDIDAIYTMASNVVTLVNGKELLIPVGTEYRPGDNLSIGSGGASSVLDINGTLTLDAGESLTVYGTLDSSGAFAGFSATVDVNGTLAVSAGVFTAPSTTMTVSGTVDLASGVYAANSGILQLDGAQQQTLSAGGNTFNEVRIVNGSGAGVIFDEALTTATFLNTTAGSRMTFQHNTTFTISSLLTLNGSSGNEIILNSDDGTNRFTFAVTGGTQTVSYVNVSNSQASSNNIIANNSTNNTNTDSGESAPRWIFVVQPDLLIDTGRFTLTSGTGNLSVTGVGFQPSAYILFLTKNDTDDANSAEGTGNGSMLSIGMTDGTRQFCMASGVEDDQGTADVGRRGFTDEVVCNIDVGDENQSVRGEANHVSFDADGFTINRGVTFSEPASVLVEYIAFGGSDLDVYVDTVDLDNTVDNSVDVTGPGFEPDLVLSSFIGRLVDGTGNINNDDHSMSFGWAVNPAVQPANNQLSITTVSRDAVGTSETLTRFDTVRAGVTITDSTQAAAYEFENFDASGFDVTTRLAGAVANELMGYLALDVTGTAYIYSGTRTALTTSGNDIDGNAAFQPIFLMGMGSAVATTANTNTDGGSLAIGMTDGTDTLSMSIHDEDNAGTSNTHSRTTNTQLLVGYAEDGTVDWEASFTSFDESGYTLNYGDAASASYLTGFLAIGLNAAPTTIYGNVLQSDQATSIGANRTVSLSVNGQNAVQSVETDASGNYNFNVDTDPADVVAVYIDDETENAVTVSVSDGSLLGGYDLYQDFLVIRNDNSGSTTNGKLAMADNNGDSDITAIYTMSGNALTMAANVGLVVQAGQTYAPGNVVNANDVDINGIFTMAASAITISGSLDATGGTFTSSGTVTFDATDARGILSNSNAFQNIVFNGASGTWVLEDALDANGNLFILNGTLDVNVSENNAVSVGGGWQNSASFLPRSGTVTFDGTGAQTLTTCNGCSAGDFYNVVVTNGSGSPVAFEDSFSVVNLTAVTADTSMTFEAGTTATISGNLSLNGGASGDEIILNSSDGTTRFTFDVTGGNQTVSYVNVSNSQASSNNITANNAIQGANTDAAEGTPHWIFGGGGGGPLKGAIIIVD